MSETEALVAVVRPSGQAMFHTQDCAHGKRAMSPLYALPSDFAPGDVWCSSCRPTTTHAEDTEATTKEADRG